MKEWRPQVLAGTLVLGILAALAMYLHFEQVAILCGGGIVSAVTALATNGKRNGG